MEASLYSHEGNVLGKIPLNKAIFGAKVKPCVIQQVEIAYLAGLRRGTASTKNRSEVSGGGRKPWKQKGTGRARAGSSRSPHWKGGGVAFGPRPRSYVQGTPAQLRQQAVIFALADKAQAGQIMIIEPFQLSGAKTKTIAQALQKFPAKGKMLLVLPEHNQDMVRSCRNLPWVEVCIAKQLNIHALLKCDYILIFKDALSRIEEVLCRN